MEGHTKIYLITNCYGDPNKVYIGKTKNNRKSDHKKRLGSNITYDIIDGVDSLDRKHWKPLESYWIEQFRQWGFELINTRKIGGSGPEYHTNETKQKISEFNKNREYKEIWKVNASKPKPEGFGDKLKTKDRISKIVSSNQPHYQKGSLRNKKISQKLKGRKHSLETIQKLSQPKPKGFGDRIKSKERNKKIGQKNSKPILKLKNGEILQEYPSLTEASKDTNVRVEAICACLKNRSKTSGGFEWEYKKF